MPLTPIAEVTALTAVRVDKLNKMCQKAKDAALGTTIKAMQDKINELVENFNDIADQLEDEGYVT